MNHQIQTGNLTREINTLVQHLAREYLINQATLSTCENQIIGFFQALNSAKIYSKSSCICMQHGALAQLSDKIMDHISY